MNPYAIGIDVGGTDIRASIVSADGAIVDSVRSHSQGDQRQLEDALTAVVTTLRERHHVDAVGLAVAGFVARDRDTVTFAPHLPWRGRRVATELAARWELPVTLEHDANSALWGERCFGAATEDDDVVLVAIGTGIGAALLHGGQLYRGARGVAPELGHVQVVGDGRPCPCGKRGCWERYCSGTALVDTARELVADHPDSPLARRMKRPEAVVTGKEIAMAADGHDPLALHTFAVFARWLGVGLAAVADVFDPATILLAGGVAGSAPLYLASATAQLGSLVTGSSYRELPDIRVGALGANAAVVGAAALAHGVVANRA